MGDLNSLNMNTQAQLYRNDRTATTMRGRALSSCPGHVLTDNRFNSRLREECPSQHGFASLGQMRSVIDNWREDDNRRR